MDLHHLVLAGLPALRKCFLLVPQQQASRPQPCAHRSSCSFDHPSGLFVLKKLKILRMNQGHRSASSSRQRIDHPHPESLTTRLIPVEVDLKQQIFDVCSSLNNGHSPKGRVRQLCAMKRHERRSARFGYWAAGSKVSTLIMLMWESLLGWINLLLPRYPSEARPSIRPGAVASSCHRTATH